MSIIYNNIDHNLFNTMLNWSIYMYVSIVSLNGTLVFLSISQRISHVSVDIIHNRKRDIKMRSV